MTEIEHRVVEHPFFGEFHLIVPEAFDINHAIPWLNNELSDIRDETHDRATCAYVPPAKRIEARIRRDMLDTIIALARIEFHAEMPLARVDEELVQLRDHSLSDQDADVCEIQRDTIDFVRQIVRIGMD
jgi:hypothetical protein